MIAGNVVGLGNRRAKGGGGAGSFAGAVVADNLECRAVGFRSAGIQQDLILNGECRLRRNRRHIERLNGQFRRIAFNV